MKRPIPFPTDFSPNNPPFKKGDEIYVNWEFSNGVGGKRGIVEGCEANSEMHSGWAVKINIYERPIDSGWLIKIPV